MRTTIQALAVAASALLALSACNKAHNQDTANAPPSSSTDTSGSTPTDQSQVAANGGDQSAGGTGSTQASSNYDAAVSKAQADNRDALARCDSMSGASAKTCRDQANAALKSAMDQAEASRSGSGTPQG